MKNCNLWIRAKGVHIQTSEDISPGFDIGFDKRISKETQNELRNFVRWVESNYQIPVTLWVDFEYNHYLVSRSRKRVGFLFYWSDFSTYPFFGKVENIPQIRLPVRTEHSTIEEILASFVEAITCYYAWICNDIFDGFEPDEDEVEEILQEYLSFRG